MKNFLLGAFLTVSHLSIAQADPLSNYSMELNWSPIMEIDEADNNILIGATDKSYFIESKVGVSFFSLGHNMYSKFDLETNELIWSIDFDDMPQHQNEDVKIEDVFIYNEGLAFNYTVYSRRLDQHYLLRQYIDKDGTLSPLMAIATVSSDDDEEGSITHVPLKNDDKHLIISEHQFEDEEENRKIEFELFDSTFNSIWHTDLELPYSIEATNVLGTTVSKQNELLILLEKKVDEERGEEEIDDNPNTRHIVYKSNPFTNEVSELNLGLDSLWITSMSMDPTSESDTLIISGMYSGQDWNRLVGTFYVTVDKNTLEIITSSVQKFDDETLLHFMDEDDIADDKEIKTPFVFRESIQKEDGGVILIFEAFRENITAMSDANTGAITYHVSYYYGYIIAQNINADGSLSWTNVIGKNFHLNSPLYGGYFSIVHQDKLHIIYNDHEDNVEYWTGERKKPKFVDIDDGNISMVTIDFAGNMSYEVLAPIEDKDDMLFVPRAAANIQNSRGQQSLWFSAHKDEFKIGKFTFTN